MSVKSVLLCFLLVNVLAVLLVYVVVGVAYNRARHHKTGAELLPHLPFWTSFPAVVKVATIEWLRQ